MIKISETNKLKWAKTTAILSIILLFALFIGYSIDQIQWNHFRNQFALNGYAVKIDREFVFGIEKIIRGKEASQFLKANDANIPEILDNYELLLLKLKVKNISKIIAKPWSLDFWLSAKGEDRYSDTLINIDLPYTSVFKSTKMSVPYNPGEVRDGIIGYTIQKGKPLLKLDIFGRKDNQFADGKILLQESFWTKANLKLISLSVLYILFLLMLIFSRWQRKRKSDGKVLYLIYFVLLPLTFIVDENFVSLLSYKPFLLTMVAGPLIMILFYFVINRFVLLDFFCLAYNDKLLLIDEFVKQMHLDNPNRTKAHGNITIKDPKNKTSYIFRLSNVWVKHPTKDTHRAKEILLDLYSKSRFDWQTFYLIVALIHFLMIFYFYAFVVLWR